MMSIITWNIYKFTWLIYVDSFLKGIIKLDFNCVSDCDVIKTWLTLQRIYT